MRSFPQNSPEAAARIVALTLLSDGNVCGAEFEALTQLDAERTLGLEPGGLGCVVQTLCEDLFTGMCATGSMQSHLSEDTLAELLSEVDDVQIQATVLRLLRATVQADGHVADGEALVLDAANRRWPAAARAGAAELVS